MGTDTLDQLISTLVSEGIGSHDDFVALLGADRHTVSMLEFERRLVSQGVVSERRLLLLKGLATGHPTLDDAATPRPLLPERVARAAGAIVIDSPQAEVAFVDPSPENLELVSEALRTDAFRTLVTTAARMGSLLQVAYKNAPVAVAEQAPDVYAVFDECVRARATDVHLHVGSPPMLRIDGALRPTEHAPLDVAWMDREVRRLIGDAGFTELATAHARDFAYSYGAVRFRMNIGRDRSGLTLAGRLLAARVPDLDELGIPAAVRAFTELERGLVLVTGPTGSGKSTTLASLLDHVARTQSRHLITLEDPIEYLLTAGSSAVVSQRELHDSFVGFPEALRQALRQDPDVILVGEMRDTETARVAVTAAETGHLVFSTLHTYDAQSTVARLVSMYPEGEQDHAREKLAYILQGVVSQTLVPRAANAGRVAAMEILLSTPAIANNLRQPGGLTQLRSTMQTSRREGMQTMEMALADLVLRGVIRQGEAEARARNLDELHRYLTGLDAA